MKGKEEEWRGREETKGGEESQDVPSYFFKNGEKAYLLWLGG